MIQNMTLIQDIQALRIDVRNLNQGLKKSKNLHKEAMMKLDGSVSLAGDQTQMDEESSQMLAALHKHDDQQETLIMLRREQEAKRQYIAEMQQNLQQKEAEYQELSRQFEEAVDGGEL